MLYSLIKNYSRNDHPAFRLNQNAVAVVNFVLNNLSLEALKGSSLFPKMDILIVNRDFLIPLCFPNARERQTALLRFIHL